ncbi:MAG: hypothetical protein KC619_33305 [Myxococcales bacterium]|nr:hypothetical protein [Myxococcales bacterium]
MRALSLLALLVTGCVPTLGSEYGCGRGECPPDWTCWADGVCREPEPLSHLGELCIGFDTCDTRLCATGLDPMGTDTGNLCTLSCDSDMDCTTRGYAPDEAVCVAGACRLSCRNPRSCPTTVTLNTAGDTADAEMGCWLALPEPGVMLPTHAFCMHLENRSLDGARSCTGNGAMGGTQSCQLPGWCVQLGDRTTTDIGVCSMLCETGMDAAQCPMGSACAPIYENLGQCLIPCTPGSCTDANLECVEHGDGNSYCMPSSWAGMLPRAGGATLQDIVGNMPMMM